MTTRSHLLTLAAGTLLLAPGYAPGAPRLHLADVLQEARRHNPEIRVARERARAAAALPARAAAWDDPVVTWEAWNAPEPFSIGRADNNIFRLSQKSPFPGKRTLAGVAATHDADAAARAAQAVELDVLAEVIHAYWSLWQAGQRVDVYEREQILVERLTHVAEQRYALGEASQADVLRAQVVRTHAQTRVITERLALDSTRATLNAFLSRAPDTALAAPEEPTFPRLDDSPERLIAAALERRPEVAAQAAVVAREDTGLRLARKGYLPDFELSVGRFVNYRAPNGVGAMASMTIPLAFKGKYDAGVEEANARLASARAERRRIEDAIRREVQQAFLRLRAALLQHELLVTTHIPQAKQALHVSEAAYQTGGVDFLTLVESVRAIEEAHIEHIEAAGEAQKAYADLERATASLAAPPPPGDSDREEDAR